VIRLWHFQGDVGIWSQRATLTFLLPCEWAGGARFLEAEVRLLVSMGAALLTGLGRGAGFALPVILHSGIHFGLPDCSVTPPSRPKQPQSRAINCNAKFLYCYDLSLNGSLRIGSTTKGCATRPMQRMVTLWDFLTLLCFAMPITGALAQASTDRVGVAGCALAATAGLLLGACCASLMRVTARKAIAGLRSPNSEDSPSRRKWALRGLYFVAMLWMGVALFLGGQIAALLLHLIS